MRRCTLNRSGATFGSATQTLVAVPAGDDARLTSSVRYCWAKEMNP